MIITVDTGGTKTLVATFSDAGDKLEQEKFPSPSSSDDYTAQVAETITRLSGGTEPSIISIALPDITKGKTSSYLVESFSHLPWKNFNVVESLQPHFPNSKIIAANDANLGGLGEARMLENPPSRVLYVTISTGIGTGVIIDGKLDNDFTRTEGGHLMLEYNGSLQDWDAFGSGKAVYEQYGMYGSDISDPEIWKQITTRISRGFLVLLPVIRPDLVIIGGSMGTHFDKYHQYLVQELADNLPQTLKDLPSFVQAQTPEEAVIYGCYYYALDHLA